MTRGTMIVAALSVAAICGFVRFGQISYERELAKSVAEQAQVTAALAKMDASISSDALSNMEADMAPILERGRSK